MRDDKKEGWKNRKVFERWFSKEEDDQEGENNLEEANGETYVILIMHFKVVCVQHYRACNLNYAF